MCGPQRTLYSFFLDKKQFLFDQHNILLFNLIVFPMQLNRSLLPTRCQNTEMEYLLRKVR